MAKTAKTQFVEDFKKMNEDMKPLMLDFMRDNNIHIKPFLFFLATLIKESLKFLEENPNLDDEFTESSFTSFKEALLLFILGADE